MTTEAAYADVLAKVRELALEEGAVEPWRMINSAREPLGLDFTTRVYDRAVERAQDKYKNQVRRALAALAADGTLVKVGTGNRSEYRTPAVHEQRSREYDETVARQQAFMERLAAQRARLAALGVDSRVKYSRVELDPDQLDALMDLAEKGSRS